LRDFTYIYIYRSSRKSAVSKIDFLLGKCGPEFKCDDNVTPTNQLTARRLLFNSSEKPSLNTTQTADARRGRPACATKGLEVLNMFYLHLRTCTTNVQTVPAAINWKRSCPVLVPFLLKNKISFRILRLHRKHSTRQIQQEWDLANPIPWIL